MNYYAISDDVYVIAHHGIVGMKWGIRRFQPYGKGGYNPKTPVEKRSAKLNKKIDSAKAEISRNNEKINDLNNYSNSKRNQKLARKRLSLETRRAKYDKRVNKARIKREVYNKEPNLFEKRALKKAYKLETKISRVIRKQNAWKQKVSKLEYRNLKLEHKVDNYVRKLDALKKSD